MKPSLKANSVLRRSVAPRRRLVCAVALSGALAFAPPLAAAARGATTDAAGLQAVLQQFQSGTGATNPVGAAEAQAEYKRRLGEAQEAVQECASFLKRYGSHDRVVRILNWLRQRPGEAFFTSPEIVAELERAVGESLDLGQREIELCVQARDRQIGTGAADAKPATFVAIDVRLRKCLSTLNAVGPNAAGTAVLERLSRRVRDETFTSAATRARLKQAVGRSLHLTPQDLETCVDAFGLHLDLERITTTPLLARPGDDTCDEGYTYCIGTESPQGICCKNSNSYCAQNCNDEGECAPYCEATICFPADATVRTEAGAVKAMRDVRLGDRLQVAMADGSLGYEEVYLNTHKDGTSSASYAVLKLASGRALTLSPRHFIPVAQDAGAVWEDRVTRDADEVRPGDFLWSRADNGGTVLDQVVESETEVAVGAYNPLTMNGTIVVDGVVASAHSDWFLDGVVSADTEAKVYQAILAPVRLAYGVIGPEWMETVTEQWGVVDLVREATTPGGNRGGLG
jgi:hypothetical protein